LDNSGYTRDSLATRSGHLVYLGWLHPHPARLGDHRHIDPRHPRAQTGLTFRAKFWQLPREMMVYGQFSDIRTDYAHPAALKAGAHFFELSNFGDNPAIQEST
jgi:hypothetical protein